MKKLLLIASVFILSALPVLAEGAAAPAKAKPQGGMSMFIMFGGIIVIMYFLMIRPQQKKQKEKAAMLNAIEPGDKIITIGGIYGTVKKIKDNSVRIQIDDHTNIELAKSSISTVVEKANASSQQQQAS